MTQRPDTHSPILVFQGPRTRNDAVLDKLPGKTIARWTATAKKAVLDAIRAEALTVTEACKRYELTADELESWDRKEQMYGRNGLMATQISRYRRASQHRASRGVPSRNAEADTL